MRTAVKGIILIVDDDPRFREPMVVILSAAGYAVIEAVDGLDALEQLRAGFCKPTAIVLDVEMPRLDGRGFLRELETAPAPMVPSSRVILVSAASEVAEVAAEFRVSSYFGKPFVVDRLLEAIANVHKRHREYPPR